MTFDTRAVRMLADAALARALDLGRRFRESIIEGRRLRQSLELELYRGRYRLRSKCDDDLPIAL